MKVAIIPKTVYFTGMKVVSKEFFDRLEPVTLDQLRRRSNRFLGRPSKLNIYLFEGRWVVLVWRAGRGRWQSGQADEYLCAETSGKPRGFVLLDTAVRLVMKLRLFGGVYIDFEDLVQSGASIVGKSLTEVGDDKAR